MATERKNQFQFELESNPLHKNALKGEAWIRKIYRDLVFKVCKDCGDPHLRPQQICFSCKAKRDEEARWITCSCGEKFRLEDEQNRQTKKCPKCKEDRYFSFYTSVMTYFHWDHFTRFSLEDRIHEFAMVRRNEVQSATPFSNFKLPYEFVNVNWKIDKTWEHINSMTILIESLVKILIDDESKRTFEFVREYLLKYGVQFRTSASQNLALIPYQSKPGGITPEEYISIVGNIKGKTKEETIDIIKKHFINHG